MSFGHMQSQCMPCSEKKTINKELLIAFHLNYVIMLLKASFGVVSYAFSNYLCTFGLE